MNEYCKLIKHESFIYIPNIIINIPKFFIKIKPTSTVIKLCLTSVMPIVQQHNFATQRWNTKLPIILYFYLFSSIYLSVEATKTNSGKFKFVYWIFLCIYNKYFIFSFVANNKNKDTETCFIWIIVLLMLYTSKKKHILTFLYLLLSIPSIVKIKTISYTSRFSFDLIFPAIMVFRNTFVVWTSEDKQKEAIEIHSPTSRVMKFSEYICCN